MRFYLVGYMYSGKSTVGRSLAKAMGCRFVDLDELFEERYRTTVPLFFHRYDEVAFRRLEQQLLHTTSDMDEVVISTGGGTACYADNMEWINAHGTSVYLDVSVECVLLRASHSRKIRPILTDLSDEERGDYVRRQMSQREDYYRLAHHRIAADNPDINALVALLR